MPERMSSEKRGPLRRAEQWTKTRPLTRRQLKLYRSLYRKAHGKWPRFDLPGINGSNVSQHIQELDEIITGKHKRDIGDDTPPLVKAKQLLDSGFYSSKEIIEETGIKPYHLRRLRSGEEPAKIMSSAR